MSYLLVHQGKQTNAGLQTIFQMHSLFQELFAANFMPHVMCLREVGIIRLHVLSDALIALAYLLIPLALLRFIRLRKDLAFSWMFILFGLFIFGCSCTHILSIWTLWIPVYRFEGTVKFFTALISLGTAICLLRLIPVLVALPSPEQLRCEIDERKEAEAEVRRLNADLERRVEERTVDLVEMNRTLMDSQEDLDSSNRRLNLALSAGAIGIWEFNPDANVVSSDTLSVQQGQQPCQVNVAYDLFLSQLHPDDRKRVDQAVRNSLDPASGGKYEVEYRTLDSASGELRHIKATGRTLSDSSQTDLSPNRILGTTIDITEQKKIQESLLQANDDLRQFAYAAAHDLQEPLRNIAISAELLDLEWSDRWDDKSRVLVQQTIGGSQRVHQMIKDLLAYTRVVDEYKPVQVRTSSACALKEALANLSITIAQTQTKIAYDTLPELHVSSIHLLQLFQNIIGNALKYRRSDIHPEIQIKTWKSAGKWTFRISDNGIGFDQLYAERIFGIFKRLHQRDEYQGNGIGLAICARIVSHYGGQIWAEGQPEKGAAFFFSLPA